MLQIEHFSKTYPGGKKAVDDLTLAVNAGEIVGFIGHNGAGKTTTLRAVAGILAYDQGTITDVYKRQGVCGAGRGRRRAGGPAGRRAGRLF